MASVAQIEANRRNALKSTGPTSPEARWRAAGTRGRTDWRRTPAMARRRIPDSTRRLAEWEAEHPAADARPRSWRCGGPWPRRSGSRRAGSRSMPRSPATGPGPSRRGTRTDLPRPPTCSAGSPASPRSSPTSSEPRAHGVALCIRVWDRLAEALDAKDGGWDDPEIATACDLLGIPSRPPLGPAARSTRRTGPTATCARRGVRSLRADRAASTPGSKARWRTLDALDHEIADPGSLAMLTRPVQLILRYEAAANRVFDRDVRPGQVGGRRRVGRLRATPEPDKPRPTSPARTARRGPARGGGSGRSVVFARTCGDRAGRARGAPDPRRVSAASSGGDTRRIGPSSRPLRRRRMRRWRSRSGSTRVDASSQPPPAPGAAGPAQRAGRLPDRESRGRTLPGPNGPSGASPEPRLRAGRSDPSGPGRFESAPTPFGFDRRRSVSFTVSLRPPPRLTGIHK